jgi:type I restriction enzyme S subunit
MTGQNLKNSILQLAIQGKLVEQREEEGTAKELLKKIEAEKKQLIKEGRIKKQKALPEINDDESPFDIPESWEWVRLGDLTHNWGQKKPDTTFDYIDVGSIDNVNGRLSDDENLIDAKNAPSRARKVVKKGSVIYSTVRPYLLNICVIDKEFKYEPIASTAFAILHPYCGLDQNYLYHVLMSPMFISYVNSMMLGVAYPAINDTNLLSGLVPLPPLEEQKRIIAKIEELMPYVDKYDVAYFEVEELNKKFPEDMQKSILQYAIQGNLVEQREEDGTAEDLYKQIQEEKKKLIKEGKIKKTKSLPEITEDEVPFDIPENWKWVRLGDVIHNWGQKKPNKTFDYIDVGSIDNINGMLSEEENLIDPKDAPSRARKIVKEGSVIYSTVRPYLLNICIINKEFEHEPIASTAFAILHPIKGIYNKYLYFILKSPMFISYVSSVMIGVAYPAINDTNLLAGLIPLPPLAEQKRIVEKIEELLPYTKQLIKKVD